MANNAIYYDASKCTACKACQVNCKQWNQLPAPLEQTEWTGNYESPKSNSGDTWIRLTMNEVDTKGGAGVGWAFGRDACQHCTKAACVSVCPTGAMHYDGSGAVALDEKKCIACQFCITACPFNVPKFSNREGVTRKCWMCQDRIENGIAPACVSTCPTGALDFCDRAEAVDRAKARVDVIKDARPDAIVYGEKELDGLHVIQVLPYGAEAHGMPVNPTEKLMNTVERWLRPLTIAGVVGITGVALASFIGGRGFDQEEALSHNYPKTYGKRKIAKPDEVVVEDAAGEGSDA